MTQEVTMAKVTEAIDAALEKVLPPADTQCRAAFPHPGLIYQGKGVYHCPCGKIYRKDGDGGLAE